MLGLSFPWCCGLGYVVKVSKPRPRYSTMVRGKVVVVVFQHVVGGISGKSHIER